MTNFLGAILIAIVFLFVMDLVFERIPACTMNGVERMGAECMVEYEEFETLSFYDPTVPETERWETRNLLIQLSHPTIRKKPRTWLAWRVGWRRDPLEDSERFAYHNSMPSLLPSSLPLLEPSIRLADGSLATDIRQLSCLVSDKLGTRSKIFSSSTPDLLKETPL